MVTFYNFETKRLRVWVHSTEKKARNHYVYSFTEWPDGNWIIKEQEIDSFA